MPLKLKLLLALCAPLLAAVGSAAPEGAACPALPNTEQARITAYIAKKYEIPEKAALNVKKASLVAGGCYRELLFAGQGPLGQFTLKLYLSPDFQFLSPEILDSRIDPEVEAREKAETAMGQLLEGDFASRGSPSAPVTVVFFADFQCPFCNRAQQVLKAEPLLKDGQNVRLVFRHMPLPNHRWARQAALAAACAQFQNAAAFWSLSDALFANQNSITSENFRVKTDDFISHIPSLDQKQFSECVDRQMSLGLVLRDKDLATHLNVQATPTFFINGRKVEGAPEAAELHAMLEKALAATRQTAKTDWMERAGEK